MRIISGIYGRRRISPPKKLPVRPTTDLAKESLFNILHHRIDWHEKTALDLFSGTGAISYELISRGCKQVIAVEQNFQCVKFIKSTSEGFQMEGLKVMRSDAFRFIKTSALKFDFIFADPPYALKDIDQISELIVENDLLAENGWMVIEHPKEIDFSEQALFYEHRKYGAVNFSFFSKTQTE